MEHKKQVTNVNSVFELKSTFCQRIVSRLHHSRSEIYLYLIISYILINWTILFWSPTKSSNLTEPIRALETILNQPYFNLDSGLRPKDITCLGISTQRGTFVNWSRTTGKAFHNFITWKDLRADALCREWDNSYTMRVTTCFWLSNGNRKNGHSVPQLIRI